MRRKVNDIMNSTMTTTEKVEALKELLKEAWAAADGWFMYSGYLLRPDETGEENIKAALAALGEEEV